MTSPEQEILDALEQAQRDAEKLADELEDAFHKALVKAQGHAAERIANILAEAPDFSDLKTRQRMQWWIDHKNAIDEALATSGYHNAVTAYVNALPQFAAIVEATQSALGESFISFPKATIDFLKARQVEQFQALGTRANTALSDMLYGQVFGGAKKKHALGLLKSTITGTYQRGNGLGMYQWHAGTYARTNHFKFLRELDGAQADAHGLTENFVYLGPVDEKTRPFCRNILKSPRAYTKAEIQAMDNGFRTTHPEVADVFTCGGGFNCRHRWLSVTPSLAAKLNARAKEVEERQEQFRTQAPDVETAPANWKEATSVREAEQWARDNRLAAQHVDYRGFKVAFANKVNYEMAKLLREFPSVRIDFLGTESGARAFWAERKIHVPATDIGRGMFATTPIGGRWPRTISFPAQFFNDSQSLEGTRKFVDRLVAKNWMSPFESSDYQRRIIYHEFGHALDFERRVLSSSEFRALAKTWADDAGGPLTVEWVKKNLCGYAAEVPAEVFSEGFAEYILAHTPRSRMREVGELLMRMHGRGVRKP